MSHKRIIAFLIVCVAPLPVFNTNDHNLGTGTGHDFSTYFLRTDHPLSKFDSASFPSVEDMILARNYENDFLQKFDGNWRKSILTESEYETSSKDKCKNNNGNCTHRCETISDQVVCSCDEDLILIDGTDCHPNTSGSVVFSGTSGKFHVYGKENQWIIKAPENHAIELEIIKDTPIESYQYMQYHVYDGHCTETRLAPYHTLRNMHKYISSGPQLCITTDAYWPYDDIFASYKTVVCYNGGTWDETKDQCICKEEFSGEHCEDGLGTVCENGGIWDGTHQSCMCPPGFVGVYCEEGCGANRYGKNCAEICSILSTECEGVIFCRANVCTCAPGLYGKRCDIPCPEGWYGASCRQHCGKCSNNNITCDKYSGKCDSKCSPGYYPPLCQQTYKVVKSAPEIVDTGYRHLKFSASLWNQSGQGQPKFFDVQYKAMNEESWSRLPPRSFSNTAEFVINNLLPGHFYSVRIILIDQDGESCELNVPETKVMTKCMEPSQADFHLVAKEISMKELTLEWSYVFDRNADLCFVKEFELSLMSENKQLILPSLQNDGTKKLSGLLPNTNYRIQLTGITEAQIMVPSPEITVHTLPTDPGKVLNVQVVPLVSSRELKVTWKPPRNSAGVKLKYHISYTCLKVLACGSIDHTLSTQGLMVDTTSALLGNLQPHSVYQIKIAALTADGFASAGYTTLKTTTEHTVPRVAPSAVENPILGVTNVSASISWLPPTDCALLNGYLYGYSYKLVDNETGEVLKENTVPENVQFVNFTALRPNHCYDAEITVVSSGGVDSSNRLVIPFCTSPTGPDQVQFLEVYKRSRKMVGLKWDTPLNTYGEIESFIISYSEQGTENKNKIKTSVKPRHCPAWPDSYCHTISHLLPARRYSFTVQARNNKVSADGEPASVEAVTSEGAATAPVNLTVISVTENSVTLEWQLPDNINGYLRSFIIMTGQVDTKGASDECCESIPLLDYRVTSEEPSYRYEINGLSAASTYSMTVAAKTLTLGEEARIIAHTQPPKGLLAKNAIEVAGTEENTGSSVAVSLKVQPVERLHGVKRTYYLLLLSNATTTEHAVQDKHLRTLLEARFTDKYHLISKYTQDELEEHPLIQFHPRDLGFENADIHSFRYALVMIQDYMSNTSVDISVSGI